ncbi:hypothetical protein [Mucilaginibacter gossypiicola]|uniref:hypothetical protein n=1 Tax=Mucilaginibacter gossypiicola TaxID=551995 RepID=UPI00115FFA55|nr:hypothetical protein [Mucilaginibacter gossypiicola]
MDLTIIGALYYSVGNETKVPHFLIAVWWVKPSVPDNRSVLLGVSLREYPASRFVDHGRFLFSGQMQLRLR